MPDFTGTAWDFTRSSAVNTQTNEPSTSTGHSSQVIVDDLVEQIEEDITARVKKNTLKDRLDWMLCPRVFQKINHQLGLLEIDLFPSRLSTQLPTFVSWRPDPEVMATDAFMISWTGMKAYANPP